MTPNKLPPLPDSTDRQMSDESLVDVIIEMSARMTTQDALKRLRVELLGRLSALRQSQSLPAGAVAGLVVVPREPTEEMLEAGRSAVMARDCSGPKWGPADHYRAAGISRDGIPDRLFEGRQKMSKAWGAELVYAAMIAAAPEQALQSDAREKGEAGHKPVAFRWLRNGLPVCSWTDGVPPETAMQRADDLKGYADWQVEYAYSSLATQPAQASEKDNG